MVPGLEIGLALVAAIGVHVEVAEDVSSRDREALVSVFGAALSDATGAPASIDPESIVGCSNSPACVKQAAKRIGVERVVFLQIFAGISKIRVFVRLASELGAFSETTQLDLGFAYHGWSTPVRASIGRLLSAPLSQPERSAARTVDRGRVDLVAVPSPSESSPTIPGWAYATIGAGCAIGVVAGGLYGVAVSDHRRLDEQLAPRDARGRVTGVSYAEAEAAWDSIDTKQSVALGLAITSATVLIAGAIWAVVASL